MSSFSINQWAEEDKPREKLMAKGAAALSDSELLAILIGSGSTKESAVGLMQRILADCDNNLNTLGKMSQIGRASVGKECVRRCRSRWSPYH